MKYSSVSTLIVSFALAGFGCPNPASAASLPTTATHENAARTTVVVEGAFDPLSVLSLISRPLAERPAVAPIAGELTLEASPARAPWQAALGADVPQPGPSELIDAVSLLAAAREAPLPLATGADGQVGARLFTGLAGGSGPRGKGSKFTWKLLLMVMPTIGGMFIAWDARRGWRKRRHAMPEGVLLYDSPGPRAAPAPLASLGLAADCDEEDVKRAFRERAKAAHPDRGGSAQDFMSLQRNFEASLRIVRADAARAEAMRARSARRQAA